MDIHIAAAPLPQRMEAVAERTNGALYIVVAEGLSQIGTAAAVADVVSKAFGLQVTIPQQ